jgi:hypothetical protein
MERAWASDALGLFTAEGAAVRGGKCTAVVMGPVHEMSASAILSLSLSLRAEGWVLRGESFRHQWS